MLLPHGYEGQGPEHSSAKLERYLQLCAENNMQVCNITTPANYYHALRRQVHRNFRKPLVVMTPKSLLRHKLCVSKLEDFGPGTSFHRVIHDDEKLCEDKDVKRVVLCSARSITTCSRNAPNATSRTSSSCAWNSSIRSRKGTGEGTFALQTRRDRLVPGRAREHGRLDLSLTAAWKRFSPKSMRNTNVRVYVGRPGSSLSATGNAARHRREQAKLIDEALTL